MRRKAWRLIRYDLPMHFILLLTNWLPDNPIFLYLRGSLAGLFLGKCGKNFRLGRDVTFYNSSKIFVGNNVYIAKGNWFSAGEKIIIGNEVLMGPYSVIASANHTIQNGSYRYGKPLQKPTFIGDGSWIAANCTITAGSKIGKSCLIAANTVTKGTISDSVVYGGVPGKVIS
jgi:acetyltransferase-like isoleucine patch superfamily enzyme